MELKGRWSENQIEEFLDEIKVPIRIACNTKHGLWMVSLWFIYRDGNIYCASSKDSDIVSFLRDYPDIAFEISTNNPPYRGVRGRGKVELEEDPDKELLKELFNRYIENKDIPLKNYLFSDDREEININIEPSVLYSWDFTERM